MPSSIPPKRVLVTRSSEDAAALSEPLRRAGFDPVEVPLIKREAVPGAVTKVVEDSEAFDWLVITSGAALEAVQEAMQTGWVPPKAAAVGPSSARRAEAIGLNVVRVPTRATSASLVAAMGQLHGHRVLFPRARVFTAGTVDTLRAAGAEVTEIVAYDNVAPRGIGAKLRAVMPVHVITLLSGSAAERLVATGIDVHAPIVAIGPSTERAATRLGLTVSHVATPHTVAGVVAGVKAVLRGDRAADLEP